METKNENGTINGNPTQGGATGNPPKTGVVMAGGIGLTNTALKDVGVSPDQFAAANQSAAAQPIAAPNAAQSAQGMNDKVMDDKIERLEKMIEDAIGVNLIDRQFWAKMPIIAMQAREEKGYKANYIYWCSRKIFEKLYEKEDIPDKYKKQYDKLSKRKEENIGKEDVTIAESDGMLNMCMEALETRIEAKRAELNTNQNVVAPAQPQNAGSGRQMPNSRPPSVLVRPFADRLGGLYGTAQNKVGNKKELPQCGNILNWSALKTQALNLVKGIGNAFSNSDGHTLEQVRLNISKSANAMYVELDKPWNDVSSKNFLDRIEKLVGEIPNIYDIEVEPFADRLSGLYTAADNKAGDGKIVECGEMWNFTDLYGETIKLLMSINKVFTNTVGYANVNDRQDMAVKASTLGQKIPKNLNNRNSGEFLDKIEELINSIPDNINERDKNWRPLTTPVAKTNDNTTTAPAAESNPSNQNENPSTEKKIEKDDKLQKAKDAASGISETIGKAAKSIKRLFGDVNNPKRYTTIPQKYNLQERFKKLCDKYSKENKKLEVVPEENYKTLEAFVRVLYSVSHKMMKYKEKNKESTDAVALATPVGKLINLKDEKNLMGRGLDVSNVLTELEKLANTPADGEGKGAVVENPEVEGVESAQTEGTAPAATEQAVDDEANQIDVNAALEAHKDRLNDLRNRVKEVMIDPLQGCSDFYLEESKSSVENLCRLNEGAKQLYDGVLSKFKSSRKKAELENAWKKFESTEDFAVADDALEKNTDILGRLVVSLENKLKKIRGASEKNKDKKLEWDSDNKLGRGVQRVRGWLRKGKRKGAKLLRGKTDAEKLKKCFENVGKYFVKEHAEFKKDSSNGCFDKMDLLNCFASVKGLDAYKDWYGGLNEMLNKTDNNFISINGDRESEMWSKLFVSLVGFNDCDSLYAACAGLKKGDISKPDKVISEAENIRKAILAKLPGRTGKIDDPIKKGKFNAALKKLITSGKYKLIAPTQFDTLADYFKGLQVNNAQTGNDAPQPTTGEVQNSGNNQPVVPEGQEGSNNPLYDQQ